MLLPESSSPSRGISSSHKRGKDERVTAVYRGADKSFSLSIAFSVQGTGGSSAGPDPENRVGDQDTGSPGRPVSFGLQVPGESFPSWSG
jgi:hypothetical protein